MKSCESVVLPTSNCLKAATQPLRQLKTQNYIFRSRNRYVKTHLAITLELPRIKFVSELQKAQRYSHSATVYPSISETELAVLSEC